MSITPSGGSSPINTGTRDVSAYPSAGEDFKESDIQKLIDNIDALSLRLGVDLADTAAAPFWKGFATLADRLDSALAATTASNEGTGGVGVFHAKVLENLEFRNINNATDGAIAVTLDAGNKEVDLAVDIDNATEETVFDDAFDRLLFYDSTAGANRKIKASNLPASTARDNHVIVKSVSDLPAPGGGVHALAANTTYELNGEITSADGLDFAANTVVIGVNRLEDKFTYTGTVDALILENNSSAAYNFSLSATAASANAIFIQGTGAQTVYVDNLIVDCHTIGRAGNVAQAIIRNNIFVASTEGLTLQGTLQKGMVITENTFDYSLTDGILIDAAFETDALVIESNTFKTGNAADHAVSGTPAAINEKAQYKNNLFIGPGTLELDTVLKSDSGWRFDVNRYTEIGETLGTTPGPKVITHNLGTTQVSVTVIDTGADEEIEVEVNTYTLNTVTVEASGATVTVDILIQG